MSLYQVGGHLVSIGGALLSTGSTSFDFFIAPNGDDNNSGTLASPWSITALNSKQSTYAGKKIGIIGDISGTQTPIQFGTVGGVQTTLYSLCQTLSNDWNLCLTVNGGTSSPTYLASCNSSGAYSPRWAIIDCAQPGTGTISTGIGSLMGQSNGNGSPGPVTNYGNVTWDGLTLRNFGSAGILIVFSGIATGVTIQNCELHDAGINIPSNGNPGAIYLHNVDGTIINNCKIHDLISTGPDTSSGYQYCGIITFGGSGGALGLTHITNCTFYNLGGACSSKDFWQQMNISYCYLGWGPFGAPYIGTPQYQGLGGTVQNYLTTTGATINFHHNILLGPLLSWGESGQENEGQVNIFNNTFYEPSIGSGSSGIITLYNPHDATASGGTWEFYNNLVYSLAGYNNGTVGAPAAFSILSVNTKPAMLALCDHNAYGSGMGWAAGYGNVFNLSGWQGLGFDPNSTILSSSPFTGTPSEANASSFAITGAALTAGIGGTPCGALDGSGSIGCNF